MGLVNEAIILAGGRGTRMLPASLFSPKEFLPLFDVPIIKHLFEECIIAGIAGDDRRRGREYQVATHSEAIIILQHKSEVTLPLSAMGNLRLRTHNGIAENII